MALANIHMYWRGILNATRLTTNTGLPGIIGMVEHQYKQEEQQNPLKRDIDFSDRFQCIPGRIGCILLRADDGGPWSHQECTMHINCLELLLAMLTIGLRELCGNNLGNFVAT